MPDERIARFQVALDQVLQKSKENKYDDVTLSLSLTALQVAIDHTDPDKALTTFEDCADLYAAQDQPDDTAGLRLGRLSSDLHTLLTESGEPAQENEPQTNHWNSGTEGQ
ncbi:hypothetical protein [Actinokineospora sp. NBRC 105648]|uniref:hypothetical protein n=1 Tax=Actinokineospora sp. NBRC 105648 TaxID=3032206 RepID=UPI0024A1B621|nr:hypothetical protein [Actinokineospora sp. NBRC 105648]GLZ37643.1 hypothetical protein Acsp05_12680 [Actinokineospora sp. NBRC 105648]